MSSARAQANHCLYLAKILLAGWQRALTAQDVAAGTLNQAFLPGARQHLLGAYGWFLLELTGADPSAGPPRGCGELPEVPAGKAVSGEIREFQQLEANGWLAELLAEPGEPAHSARTAGNLVTASPGLPDCAQVQQWINRLEALFDRMSDSLDEY